MTTITPMRPLDVAAVRAEFPVLGETVHGRPLVYLDNAATTQKPRQVLDALRSYYEHDNANVHRGVHTLSVRATDAHDAAREKVRAFINARSTREVVFTRNSTEAINLVARAWGDANVRAGDEVLITAMEHHSNIVPWQLLCERDWRASARGTDRRPRRPDHGRVRAPADRPHADRRRGASLERARHDQPGRRDRAAGARCRRRRADRWIAGGVSHADRRRGARRRLLRLHRTQARTARRASACCTGGKRCSRRCRRSSAAAT